MSDSRTTAPSHRRTSLRVLLAIALLAGAVRAEAHHSFTGAYNVDKQITITGKIVQIAIRSPHSFFYVETQDDKGMTQQWAIEGASAGQFASQGIDALNRLLDMSVTEYMAQGGTMIVPGHGWVSDSGDVGYYRDMLMIVRDRIRSLIDKGLSLQQVKAAKPTMDYDPEYGRQPGATAHFVEAVYASLKNASTKR